MRFLRTNTAIRLTVGPFFDKTDGVTPETALTVTSCKLTLMVDDANVPTLVLDTAPTASGGANDMVHVTGDDAGFYDLELAAANVNYLGRAMLAITDAATHCPVFHEFMILPAMIYDSLVLGTDDLDTNTKKWNDLTTVALPLVPTTAGRTLDVTAAGNAGIDWANVEAPTTTLALTGTTIATTQKVDLETIKTNPVVNAGTVTFPTAATLASTTNITAATGVDVTKWLGTAVATPTVAGVPEVDVTHMIGTTGNTSTVVTVADGYVGDGYFQAKMEGFSSPTETIGATGNDTTHLHLSNYSQGDDEINDMLITIYDVSTGEIHSRWVEDWVASTKLATVATLPFTPQDNTDLVYLWQIRRNALALSQSFPTNFSSLGINASGHVSRVTLADTLTTYTGNTPQTGDAYARLGAPAGASVSADVAAVKVDTGNLVTRITSTLFSGITSLGQWLGLMAGKQTANSTALTEIKATGAGSGTYSEATDSQEALRDRGDAAWVTATGFSTLDAAGVRTAIGMASANLDTQLGTLATASALTTVGTNVSTVSTNLSALITTVGVAGAGLTAADDAVILAIAAVQADLPARITKNVALAAFPFKMVDSTDHVTAEIGVTVTAERSIDGSAFGACANSATEIASGWYKIDLAAADLNGNNIVLRFTGTGCDANEIVIVTQNT